MAVYYSTVHDRRTRFWGRVHAQSVGGWHDAARVIVTEPEPALPTETPLPAAAEAVLTFLESLGRRSEAELYLRLFRGIPKQSFALIAAEAEVVRQTLSSLLGQLRFLSELGLAAPVVVGLLDASGAEVEAEQLAEQLPSIGRTPKPHVVSEPNLVDAISEELKREQVPIIRFEPDPDTGITERFQQLGSLAGALQSRKVVLLRRQGGLGPQGDEPLNLGHGHAVSRHDGSVSIINLKTDLDALRDAEVLSESEARLLVRIQQLDLSSWLPQRSQWW